MTPAEIVEARDTRPLVCGHSPTFPHSDIGTGTAHTPDGREVCWECADDMQREDMKTALHFSAYLQDREIRTWSGGLLARVTYRTSKRVGFHGSTRVYFDAIDLNGRHWYGNSPGDGMYCRLHARKVATPTLPRKRETKRARRSL